MCGFLLVIRLSAPGSGFGCIVSVGFGPLVQGLGGRI